MIDSDTVRDWLASATEEDDYFLIELRYASIGEVLDIPRMPKNYIATIADINAALDYNSYGYGSADDAHVVFAISDGVNEPEHFKLPGTYASFEGWDWKLDKLVKVQQVSKEILVWDEV